MQDYQSSDLDMLLVTGSLQWQGVPKSSAKGGRITFFRPDNVDMLAPRPEPLTDDVSQAIRDVLGRGGALFFRDLLAQSDTLDQHCSTRSGHWYGMEGVQ